ncbi:hypothetical protein BC629DRAFT_1289794 [Irpex lacteus]|nr:hypothetical protein BC629DRAFT_1289794 [Irpex lacteus]
MVTAWQEELRKASKPSNASKIPWGYFVPDPNLVMAPSREDIRQRCVTNWLRIRSEWRYILDHDSIRTPIAGNKWRKFLHGPSDSDTQILDRFKEAWGIRPSEVLHNRARWYGEILEVGDINDTICREVAWELSRLGFRYELLTVDSIIVRRQGENAKDVAAQRTEWINTILGNSMVEDTSARPTEDIGLAARTSERRIASLQAFRRLMEDWPNRPDDVGEVNTPMQALSLSEFEATEKAIARFYIQTFVRHSGRAPLLPRLIG